MSSRIVNSSQWVRVIAGALLSCALLVWALRGMALASVWSALETADSGWLGISVLSLLASTSIRARRWGTLLDGVSNPTSFDIRQSAVFIGCAGNCLLPAHAGELVRGLVLQRRGGVSLGLSLGSIFVERTLDLIVLLIFLMVSFLPGLVGQPSHDGLAELRLGSIGLAIVIVCGGIFIVVSQSGKIVGFVEKICVGLGLSRFSVHIVGGLRALIAGLSVLRSPGRAATALVESVLIIGLSVITFWSAMLAFGITSPGFSGALFTQSVTILGMVIPSTPGYVGVFEAAVRFSLEVYDVPIDAIVAYSLALHALIFGSLIAAGVVLALRMGFSWTDMAGLSSAKPEPTS